MATIFPDVEKLVVAAIKTGLENDGGDLASGVVVATIKPAANVKPYPSKIVTVRGDGGPQRERNITKSERVGINVFANSYADASSLALLVDSIMRASVSGDIKAVETTMSPVRVNTDSTTAPEQRYMTFEIVVKASDV